jgi:hypothetical protein
LLWIFLNAIVRDTSTGAQWKLTCFYGHPDVAKRYQAWMLLRHLANLSPAPWLCLGDFNEIVSLGENPSSSIRPRGQMEAFQSTLNDCNLLDFGFLGPKFTWCNDRASFGITRERLDRAVANHGWCQSYDVVAVDVLPRYYSDYHPILVSFSRHQDIVWQKRR